MKLNATVQPIVARSGTGCEGIYIALNGFLKQKRNSYILDYGHQMDDICYCLSILCCVCCSIYILFYWIFLYMR